MNQNKLSVDFHDGYLDGILLTPLNELVLMCRDFEKTSWRVLTGEVCRLRADNFLHGNIIFDINIYEINSCPLNLIKKLMMYNEAESEKYLLQNVKDFKRKKLCLLELTSSYGCDLLALVEGIKEVKRL
jgi:hypothetical protein